jgi:hypothetical protein
VCWCWLRRTGEEGVGRLGRWAHALSEQVRSGLERGVVMRRLRGLEEALWRKTDDV